MINRIKNLIVIGVIFSFLNNVITFSQTKSDFNTQILNTYDKNEIIYLIDENGELIKLNNGMEDIVPDDLPKLSSIYVDDENFIALTKDNEIISSLNLDFLQGKKVSKFDLGFFLTVDGRVFSTNKSASNFLKNFKNIKDIKSLSDNVVLIHEQDDTFSIVGDGNNGIRVVKGLTDISEVVVYKDNIVLIIKNDGTILGFGDGYADISLKINSITNAKKFIKQDENLYVVTSDNNAIPIIEKNFKAPSEYLSNISEIIIDRFSSANNVLYKSYFVTTEGNIFYYIQSDNEVSDFNKRKIEYINTFDNVATVYESGYLTIILHRDGSINIPYNIHHELNGITGVQNVILEDQSYVVHLNDGQVITSLENFILNKKVNFFVDNENLSLYDYLNNIFIKILNKNFSEEEFEFVKYFITNSRNNLEEFIREICLSRNFLLLDISYKEMVDTLYMAILNTLPSDDEYTHINYMIIDKAFEESISKEEIINEIINYIFENPIFDNIFSKINQIKLYVIG